MREEAAQWLKQAEHDLKTSRLLLENQVYDYAAFTAFACAEKAFKAAFLELKKDVPPKTHELMALAKAVGADELLETVRELNPHFVQSRYPDAANAVPFEAYSKTIAERCIRIAEQVLAWTQKKLR